MMKSPRKHSIPHKLQSLAPGEFFILPDPNRNLDRQLITLKLRSVQMPEYSATRIQWIEHDRLVPGLKITRLSNHVQTSS